MIAICKIHAFNECKQGQSKRSIYNAIAKLSVINNAPLLYTKRLG